MSQAASTDAVLLPAPFNRALASLIQRTTKTDSHGALALKAALFGDDAPTFGQVRRISQADLATAADRTCPGTPVAALKELSELLPLVTPETPVCGGCATFPLSNVGGRIFTLPVGASCPFCSKANVELVPILLRKIAWTDGHLTEPQTTHDLRIRRGVRIPLDDDGIRAWADGWIDTGLERALKDAGTPVYAFLAYMRLGRKAAGAIDDAVRLLHEPKNFGLADRKALAETARAAKAFIGAREVTNMPSRPLIAENLGLAADGLRRVTVAGRTYLIEGRFARGDKSDVFRGFLERSPTERVVLKVCRALDDADLMRREVRTLRALAKSDDPGAYFFTTLLPQVVEAGATTGADGLERPVTVLRDRNQFDWTLRDVLREYPGGVEPQTMVWMWNRILMFLTWLHRTRWVHGGIVPDHVLIHPVYHGAVLIDWSSATRFGLGEKGVIDVLSAPNEAYYPASVFSKETPAPETDIAMSARCMIAVLGGDPATGDLPRSVPEPIADIIRVHASYRDKGAARRLNDAKSLYDAFGKAAGSVYGPRKYHPFQMPGLK